MDARRYRAKAAAFLALALTAGCGEGPPAAQRAGAVAPRFSLQGVTLEDHAGSSLRQRGEVRQLVLAPATFGPFQVAFLEELVLGAPRIDVYLDAEGPEPEAGTGVLGDPSLGVVALAGFRGGLPAGGVRLFEPTWVLWHRGAPRVRISAREAVVSRRSRVLELAGARLENLGSGKVVEAGSAVWEPGTRTFALRGGFEIVDREGRSRGDRGRIGLPVP